MKKKLLALLLSGAMILSLTTPVALAEEPEGECCDYCGVVDCVCPDEEAACEVCGEIECVCEEIEEPEVPETPEIPEEPTACEICGEIECVCEDDEEPEVPEVPEEPTNDYAELYEALMNAESIEEFDALANELTEEETIEALDTLTDEEFAALLAKIDELNGAKEEVEEEIAPVGSSTVDFTAAAPFVEPVEGVARKTRMMAFAATRAARADVDGLEVGKTVSEPDAQGVYTLSLEAWATGEKTTTTVTESVPTDIVLVLDQSGSMTFCMYENCTNENCSGNVHGSVTTYTPVSNPQAGTTYYYKNSSGNYASAIYCSTCRNWYTDTHSGCNAHQKGTLVDPTAVQFYTRNQTQQTFEKRLTALKNGVTEFVESVYEKAETDNVDHRIAIVGFASQSGYGNNTEVLTVAGSNSSYGSGRSLGVKYNDLEDTHYAAALQDVSTAAGQTMVTNAVTALAAQGATQVNLGIEMANNIFKNNPIPSGEKRNRVIIVFTDGSPTSGNSFESAVANSAIGYAKTAKAAVSANPAGYGATVYTVGIFGGANGSNPASLPDNNDTGSNQENRFMHLVSSNYPTATNMTTTGNVNSELASGESYYLSASSSEALSEIFETISDKIQSGGSSITLDENAVVKDVITDQFVLPEGATADSIKVYTAQYTAEDTFAEPVEFTNAEVSISDDGKTISVSNFNYAENWVGTETTDGGRPTYRGKKLIIEIPIEVRDGFLGGNGVLTNGDGSGVYENKTKDKPLEEFVSPDVDVAIGEVIVTPADKNMYLSGSLSVEQVLQGMQVSVGGENLDIAEPNYGLEPWQNAYVSFDGGSENLSGFTNLDADKPYSVTVTVEPIYSGTVEAVNGTGEADILVFKPYATFVDSTIYQGNSADYAVNEPGSVTWKHGDTVSTSVTMTGSEPSVDYSYDKAAAAFGDCTTVQPTPVVNGISGGSANKFTVHVLKPSVVVNLADTSAYYGTTYTPAGGSAVVSWSDTHTGIPTVTGTAPFDGSNVTLQYYDSNNTVKGAFTMTKQPVDIYVKAFHGADQLTVTGYNTTCNVSGHNCATHTKGYYTVHPLTCQLTITKKGGAAGEPYVFNVYKDGVKYSEVTIVGNGSETIYELPVGKYTIEEDMGWSWRYSDSYSSAVTLSSTHTSDSITCTNTANSLIYWLNGFSQVVKNIFTKIIQN